MTQVPKIVEEDGEEHELWDQPAQPLTVWLSKLGQDSASLGLSFFICKVRN